MKANFCGKCGAPLRQNARFCGACGERIPQYADPEPIPSAYMSPEEERPAPSQKKKTKEAKKYAPRGVGTVLLATFLCILIFIWSFAAVFLIDLRIALAPDNIGDTLNSVTDLSQVVDIPAYALIPGASDKDQTIVGWAADEIEAAYDNSIELSAEAVENFLKDSTFLPFLVGEIGDYVLDVIHGSDNSGISTDELTAVLEENAAEIGDLFGEDIHDAAIEYIVTRVENYGLLDQLKASTLRDQAPAVYYSLHIGLSYWTIGLFVLLSIVFILLLGKCNRWSFLRICGDVGAVLTAQGSVLLLTTGFAALLPDIWSGIFRPLNLVGTLIGQVLAKGIICSAVMFALGVVMIVIKSIVRQKAARSA